MPAAIVITLAIGSAAKALLGEDAILDLTLLAEIHLGFEIIDVLGPVFTNLTGKLLFPRRGHAWVLLKHLIRSPLKIAGRAGITKPRRSKRRKEPAGNGGLNILDQFLQGI